MIIEAEDMQTGNKVKVRADMVVLATGMQPAGASGKIDGINYTEDGFALSNQGVYAAGCGRNPMDVARSGQDATSAVLKAMNTGQGR